MIYSIKDVELIAIYHVIMFIESNLDKMSLWSINVIQYTAIVTILDRNNLLKHRKKWLKIKEDLIGRSTPRKRSVISDVRNLL